MNKKSLVYFPFIFLLAVLLLSPAPALAGRNQHHDQTKKPEFGFCKRPKGTVHVQYDEGWHWIVGFDVLQWGSDIVYKLTGDNYVQCYCPIDAEGKPHFDKGMQTNWWYVESLSAEKIQRLLNKNKGWILVQNGSDFGLQAGKYLAKNKKYNCDKEDGCESEDQ